MMQQPGRNFSFTQDDLQQLWQRNPMAFEQLKVICLERELGQAERQIIELSPNSPNGTVAEPEAVVAP